VDLKHNISGFDVYAPAYVPAALRNINRLEGSVVNTPPLDQLDFGAYSRGSLPFDLLPRIPEPMTLFRVASFDRTDDVTLENYEQYFQFHLEAEKRSLCIENEACSLYDIECIVSKEPGINAMIDIKVPGIQENSPYVEEDDIIELREIRHVPAAPLEDPHSHQIIYTWPGRIYNARVSRVQRKTETLTVKVRDLGIPPGKSDKYHTRRWPKQTQRFNLQFPISEKRYIPMKQILPIVQLALNHAISSRGTHIMKNGATKDAVKKDGIMKNGVYTPLSREPFHAHAGPKTFFRSEILPNAQVWFKSMLFPTEEDCKEQTSLNSGYFKRQFMDKQLNWEQQKVVESICVQNYGTLPFLISGPPGTGKTKTLVELAIQLIKNVDSVSHILFCAPSDAATDTLVQRLSAHFNPTQLFRLNRQSRSFAEVPDAVLPFCYTSDDTFTLPPFKQLMSYSIIVTTCHDASLLVYARMTNSDLYAAEQLWHTIHPDDSQISHTKLHWTALLMDEAAQAKEPEALLALSVVAPPLEPASLAFTPLFAMAGDEHQLGPRLSLHSSPLRTSLFARLFARPVYANHPLARDKTGKAPPTLNSSMLPILRPAFANLIRNYRSHPAILAVASAMFYADTLVPEATDTARLAKWVGWKGKKWPVLFHNNCSEDDLEHDGGGWYNKGEAHLACAYAAHLVQTGFVQEEEVCIMSPFKAQVQLLRKMIRGKEYGGLWKVDIGPTEVFQGLERGVVIICTTRSKERFVGKDQELGWGLVGMPNKMNVALTRAKFGLIVTGKRELLMEDPNWTAFLEFCGRNGLVAGDVGEFTPTSDGDNVERTVLERSLLAREEPSSRTKPTRVLGSMGESHDDGVWSTGMQEPDDYHDDYDENYD
jgi:putative helicase MOV10L1/helicase MOV-10